MSMVHYGWYNWISGQNYIIWHNNLWSQQKQLIHIQHMHAIVFSRFQWQYNICQIIQSCSFKWSFWSCLTGSRMVKWRIIYVSNVLLIFKIWIYVLVQQVFISFIYQPYIVTLQNISPHYCTKIVLLILNSYIYHIILQFYNTNKMVLTDGTKTN